MTGYRLRAEVELMLDQLLRITSFFPKDKLDII